MTANRHNQECFIFINLEDTVRSLPVDYAEKLPLFRIFLDLR